MEEAKFVKFLWDENKGYIGYMAMVYGVGMLVYWVLV